MLSENQCKYRQFAYGCQEPRVQSFSNKFEQAECLRKKLSWCGDISLRQSKKSIKVALIILSMT